MDQHNPAVICRARALFMAYEKAPLEVSQLFDQMRQEKEAQTLRAVQKITEAFENERAA